MWVKTPIAFELLKDIENANDFNYGLVNNATDRIAVKILKIVVILFFAEKRASNQNHPPTQIHGPDANNNKNTGGCGGSLNTTPIKANGKRIRNGESPVSVAKFPLKGKKTIQLHFPFLYRIYCYLRRVTGENYLKRGRLSMGTICGVN